jgi:phosphoribosylanthranilate isomerase
MTWVKICGITNLEDALTAVDAGADALGFVFCEKSPRGIDPETAREIVEKLPKQIEKVGVFVLRDSEQASPIAEYSGLTALQVHLQSYPSARPDLDGGLQAVCREQPRKVYLALPAAWFLGDSPMTANLVSFVERRADRPFDTILLDSGTRDLPGGTGNTFEWKRAAPLFEKTGAGVNVVVAGGLTAGNVAEAIDILKPWGVDVSSGVEARPGKKDPEKVRAFVDAVRRAEKKS